MTFHRERMPLAWRLHASTWSASRSVKRYILPSLGAIGWYAAHLFAAHHRRDGSLPLILKPEKGARLHTSIPVDNESEERKTMSIANIAVARASSALLQNAKAPEAGSPAAGGFAALMAAALESAGDISPLSPAEEARRKDLERLEAFLNSLFSDPNSPYAGKAPAALVEGLDGESAVLGGDIAALADKHGIKQVVVTGSGMMIRMNGLLDFQSFLVDGHNGNKIFNSNAYQAEMDRLTATGEFDAARERGERQIQGFLAEYRAKDKGWYDTVANLAARAAAARGAEEIDGFAEAYRADPQAAIREHLDYFQKQLADARIAYKDGVVDRHV